MYRYPFLNFTQVQVKVLQSDVYLSLRGVSEIFLFIFFLEVVMRVLTVNNFFLFYIFINVGKDTLKIINYKLLITSSAV